MLPLRMTPDPEELRAGARTTWGAGNFAAVAERILTVGSGLVERTGVAPGMEVLDVACGTGNATIPAARVGARVTGLDIVPDLLAVARERAADAMVEIELVEGDAQELPFADDRFDRVLSTFGHMFAPDHARTADELVRVAKPGGVIGFACWTPDGSVGDMFRTTTGVVGGPAPESPPPLWGTEDHVRELLGPHASEIEFSRHLVTWEDESVPQYADFMLENFGPLVMAQQALGDRAGEVRGALIEMLERWNEADDGTMRFSGEYLESIVRL
jgi:ubiquinone/menaquinone biosynthesis C-methylase UbiE